jgi:uncharacterized protein
VSAPAERAIAGDPAAAAVAGARASDRIRAIDALRGLSLAGIAMVHFGEQYLGFMPPPGEPYNVHGTADGVLEALSWIFVRGKGFGVFSFLFGLSFVLQMQRAEHRRPGSDFRPRFAWRLLVLFAIGWLHGLAYNGDILTVYASLGIPLVLFYRVPDRWILAVALVLLVGVPRVAVRAVQGPASAAERQALQERMDAQAEEHWTALVDGDLPAIVRFHATAGFRARWEFQYGFMGRGYQTFGLFLLGLWTGRHRLFADLEARRSFLVRLWRWTGALTLILPVIAGVAIAAGRPDGGPQPPGTLPDFSNWALVVGMGFFDAWNNAMTLFYVASFSLLLLRPAWRRFLLRFDAAGRTALSVYLGQTAIGVLVFFGFGLGLLGRFGNSVTFPLGLAVFALQAWASALWLRRFRFGPVEWAWRSLTWLRWEPLRSAAPHEH